MNFYIVFFKPTWSCTGPTPLISPPELSWIGVNSVSKFCMVSEVWGSWGIPNIEFSPKMAFLKDLDHATQKKPEDLSSRIKKVITLFQKMTKFWPAYLRLLSPASSGGSDVSAWWKTGLLPRTGLAARLEQLFQLLEAHLLYHPHCGNTTTEFKGCWSWTLSNRQVFRGIIFQF